MYVSQVSNRISRSDNPGEYLNYMDQFRGVSILLIVLTHVYPYQFLPSWGWDVVQNASVFFIFISGFFVHYLYQEAQPDRVFIYRKVSRILVPYLLSCLPGFFLVWLNKPELLDPAFFALTIFTGVRHYNDAHWYAPFIILIFLAYPLWRYLIQRHQLLITATCITLLIGLFTFRSQGNANPLISFIHFGGVFMAGITASLHREKINKILRHHYWKVVIVGFSAWVIVMPFVGLSQTMSMEKMLGSGRLNVDLTLLAKLFLLPSLLAIFLRLSDSGRSSELLKLLSKMSFGIFFWHFYSIYAIDQLAAWFSIESAYWAIMFRPVLVVLLVVTFLIVMGGMFPRMRPYFGVPPRKQVDA